MVNKSARRKERKLAKEAKRKEKIKQEFDPSIQELVIKQEFEPTVQQNPRSIERPSSDDHPKTTVKLVSIANQLMRWDLSLLDHQGGWSWGESRDWTEEEWESTLKPFLKNYEAKKWAEIWVETTVKRGKHKKKHVHYDVKLIKPEASKRLVDLELDDQTKIFRFRIDGPKRLYGFIFNEVFYVVWYDRTHDIYKDS